MAQPQAPSPQSGGKAATIIAVVLLLVGAAAAWFLTKSAKPFGPVLKDPVVYAVPAAELLLYIVLIGLWGRGASFKSSVGALLFAIVWRVAMAGAAAGLNKSVPISEGFATVYLRSVVPAAVTIVINIVVLAIMRRRFFPAEVAPAMPAETYAPPAPEPPVEAVPPTPPAAPEAVVPEAPAVEEEAAPAVEPEAAPAPAGPVEEKTEDALAGALAALAAQEAVQPEEEEQAEEAPPQLEETLTAPEQEHEPLPSPFAEAAEEAPLFVEEGAAEEEALFAPPEVEKAEAEEGAAFTFEVAPEEAAPVAEPEAPAPETPAPVAEEVAPAEEAPVGAVGEGEDIRVSAESVLSQFPPDALAMDAGAIQQQLDDQVFRIPASEVLPQLSKGEVRVPVSLVAGQLPPGALAISDADLSEQVSDGLIELPLEEIVPQISPAMLTHTDQVVEEFDIGEEPLFQFEIEEGEEAAAAVGEAEEAAPEPEPAAEPVEETAEEKAELLQPFAEEAPAAEPVEEAAVAAGEEPQAETVAAPPVERVRVHAESILAQFPSDALGLSPDEIVATLPDGCFEVDASHVLPQLSEGQVRVPISVIVAQLPSDALVKSEQELLEALPDGNVELPLEEVVPQLTSAITSQAEGAPEEQLEELSAPLFSFEEETTVPEETVEAEKPAEEAPAPEEEAVEEEAPSFAPVEEPVAEVEQPAEAEEEAPLFAPAEEAPAPEEEAVEEEAPLFAPVEEPVAEVEQPAEAEEEAPLFAPAEEAPAPEEEAAAEEEAPAGARVSVPGKVTVSAEAILSQIPAEVLAMEPSQIIAQLEHGVFLVDEKLVLGQLTAGEIRVDADVIAEQLPEAALTIPLATLVNELPDGTFELPLGEVVPQVKEHIVEAAPAKAEEAAELVEEPLFEQPAPTAAVQVQEEPAAPVAEEQQVVEEEAPELIAFEFEEIGLGAADRERIAGAEKVGVLERIPAALAQVAPEPLETSYFVAPHGARVALVAPAAADEAAVHQTVGNLITHVQRLAWALERGDVTAVLLQAGNGVLLGYGAPGPEGLTVNVYVAAPEGTNLGKAELLAKRGLAALKDFEWSETPFVDLEPWDRAVDFSVQQMTAEAQAATVSLTRAHKPMGATQAKLFGRADGRRVIAFTTRSVTAKLSAAGSDIADAAAQCAEALGLGAAARIVICTTDGAIGAAILDSEARRVVLCAGADEPVRPAKAAVELKDAADSLGDIRW